MPGGSPPLGEAHGGYTYCALASHFALLASPSLQVSDTNSQNTSKPASLDAHALLRWASQMQGLPIEAGGFRGRTNKLVDGCYSWWCGGLFSILGALLGEQQKDLFNRVGLQEYVLIAAQTDSPWGGLRDKPGKGADAYHSCYNLSGLSAAQHAVIYNDADDRKALEEQWESTLGGNNGRLLVKGKNESSAEADQRMKDIFCSALAWAEDEARLVIVGRHDSESSNEVLLTHPVYNLAMEHFEKMMRWSYGQPPAVGLEEVDA